MIAWIVVGSILLFFVILVLCPVTCSIRYQDALFLKIRFLFISYQILPEKKKRKKSEKKKKSKEKKVQKSEKESPIKAIIKDRGLSGFLRFIKELTATAAGALKKLWKHIRISNLSADVRVATEDAADTAIQYGHVCAVVYPSVNFLASNGKCKNYHVLVVPDFSSETSSVEFSANVHVKLCFLISLAVSTLIQIIKIMLKNGNKQTNLQTQTSPKHKDKAV